MEVTGFDVPSCLDRVRSGDDEAARELVTFLYPTVIRIVRHNLARREHEEDLAQEIFMKVFSHLASYEGRSPLVNWVSRIAVNTCLNRVQWHKIRPELRMADLSEEEAEVLQNLGSDPDVGAVQQLGARELAERMLNSLHPKDRLVLRMLEMEGYTTEEISAQTGWSKTVVRVRAFRARQKLNRQFKKIWKQEHS